MARRTAQAPDPQPANLTAAQMRAGIPKLERRIAELEAVQISSWNSDIENSLDALQERIAGTLDDVFGHSTIERRRFDVSHFSIQVSMSVMDITPDREWIRGYSEAVSKAIVTLKNATLTLNEKLEDAGENPAGQALRAYDGLDLHREIDMAAGRLYRDGHYASAIEDAVKALNALVRLRSGEELDGDNLMTKVFSPNNPILKFNDLIDESDRNEQKGFMMMFAGAVAGLRNPRAHKLIKDDPERALEFVGFVSLLAKLLDGARKS